MSNKPKTTAPKEEAKPRLRFPEFQNAGEWEVKPLGKVATYENGKAHENDISEFGQYVVVNSKFISTEGVVRKYSDQAFCPANTGDILMVLSDVPNGRAIAKCFFVDRDDAYTVNQRICKIGPNQAFGRFLFHVLDRNPYFLAFDDRVKQTNLRKDDVLNCPLCLPSVEEQTAIAECLSSLDELMTAQARKVDALKNHKKGLMQQLFPREGETQPRLRFPEFQNAGEWDWKMVGDICDCIVPGRDKPKSFTGKIPWITIPDIQQMKIHASLTELGLSQHEIKQCGAKIVPKDAVIMSCVGTFGLVSVCEQDLVINQQLHAWLPNAKIHNYYLAYCLIVQKKQMEKLATHTTISYLNKSSCNSVWIPLPPHAEQQRIASCLSSLDALITAETQKLEALKTHKKGLMQQLFPSPEEVEA